MRVYLGQKLYITYAKAITYKPAPTRALDARGGSVERDDEGVVGAPLLDDELLERALMQHATGALALGGRRREVLPEERVVDVTCDAAQSVSILSLS